MSKYGKCAYEEIEMNCEKKNVEDDVVPGKALPIY